MQIDLGATFLAFAGIGVAALFAAFAGSVSARLFFDASREHDSSDAGTD